MREFTGPRGKQAVPLLELRMPWAQLVEYAERARQVCLRTGVLVAQSRFRQCGGSFRAAPILITEFFHPKIKGPLRSNLCLREFLPRQLDAGQDQIRIRAARIAIGVDLMQLTQRIFDQGQGLVGTLEAGQRPCRQRLAGSEEIVRWSIDATKNT